jgi:hypothetical protein
MVKQVRYDAIMLRVELTKVVLILLALLASGCVRRTITITSEPSGALVWLNDREIGRTPVDVDFTYYGEYDVRLVKDGYEPLVTSGKAMPPVWDNVPLDLGAELWPGEINSRIAWHYQLEPASSDPAALLERAETMRSEFPPLEPPVEDTQGDAAGQPAAGGESGEGSEPPPDHP